MILSCATYLKNNFTPLLSLLFFALPLLYISNLLTIHALFAKIPLKDAEKHFKNKGYATLKSETAELLIDVLEPFRRKKKELFSREIYVKEILKAGARKARTVAEATMEDVRSKLGLVPSS